MGQCQQRDQKIPYVLFNSEKRDGVKKCLMLRKGKGLGHAYFASVFLKMRRPQNKQEGRASFGSGG